MQLQLELLTLRRMSTELIINGVNITKLRSILKNTYCNLKKPMEARLIRLQSVLRNPRSHNSSVRVNEDMRIIQNNLIKGV